MVSYSITQYGNALLKQEYYYDETIKRLKVYQNECNIDLSHGDNSNSHIICGNHTNIDVAGRSIIECGESCIISTISSCIIDSEYKTALFMYSNNMSDRVFIDVEPGIHYIEQTRDEPLIIDIGITDTELMLSTKSTIPLIADYAKYKLGLVIK